MKVGIIAAGLGERLRRAGFTQPKPLVPVGGRPLIDHVLQAVVAAGLRHIACIVNEQSEGIEEHCATHWAELRFEFIRRTTPSSMESLFTLSPLLAHERFLLLTVDAVFAPAVLQEFLVAAERWPAADAVLAVNDFVDDEKPLWVTLAGDGRLVALDDEARGSGWVTAGFYVLHPRVFEEIAHARAARYSALRQFFGHLLAGGYQLYGATVPKTVDVDRPEDIAVAESFIRNGYR